MGAPPLEVQIASILAEGGLTLATAESCTGGLVSHRITSVAGSSAYFLGGVVAYSNALKRLFLDVPDAVLQQHGAVSDACARAMASGIRQRTGATLGLSTTGIAGPGGATARKPVGLVYIACEAGWGTVCEEHRFTGGRLDVIAAAAETALDLALRQLAAR